MRVVLFLFLFFFVNVDARAQQIYNSATSTEFFLYKITEAEAARVVATKGTVVNEQMLHDPVVSEYTIHELLDERDSLLAVGHYLKAQVRGEYAFYEMISISPFRIEIIENNTDLVVQVYNRQNEIISDAELFVKKRRLKFDRKSKSFITKKRIIQEKLEVKHAGFTAFYNLKNTEKKNKWKPKHLLYQRPVKWLYRPLRYLVLLPVDGVKSIRRGYTFGVIGKSKYFFERQAKKIGGWFDKEGNLSSSDFGYALLSKPKYKPRDTVRFKAFVTDKKGRPMTMPLDLYFSGYRKERGIIAQVNPYAPGSYSYEFVLHDSLDLKLDEQYRVSLRKKKAYFNTANFRLEEYELGKLDLKLEADEETQYNGIPYEIKVKATDENDLPILDGRLKVKITSNSANSFQKNKVFVPYTLLEHEIPLSPEEEMMIAIPDSIFPAANLNYKVEVELLTSDNESKKAQYVGRYRWAKEVIDLELLQDSLVVFASYSQTDEPIKAMLTFVGYDFKKTQKSILPCTLKVDRSVTKVEVVTELSSYDFQLREYKSELRLIPSRTRDSMNLSVSNPRNIPFSYFLYQGNSEIDRGFGNTLDLTRKCHPRKHYLLTVQYLWTGVVETKHYDIPFGETAISVDISHPRLIYPGQETKLLVKAKNTKGEPVPGLDVTAMGLTSKFNFSPPSPKRFKKKNRKKVKRLKNNYEADKYGLSGKSIIDFSFWDELADIGSSSYYQMLFPKDDFFVVHESATDSITQFAPFVVKDGVLQTIHVIYVDNLPVYFSWSTNDRPYSFRITPGTHQIKLRTGNATIKLENVSFKPGVKTIFSVTENKNRAGKAIFKEEQVLSESEIKNLYPYIFAYKNNFGNSLAYIKYGNKISILSQLNYNRSTDFLAGPIPGRLINFESIDQFKTDFLFESNFQYDFKPGLLKMRQAKDLAIDFGYPTILNDGPKLYFKDEVITQAVVEKRHANLIETMYGRNESSLRFSSLGGEKGDLQLDFSELDNSKKLQRILFFGNNNATLIGLGGAWQREFKGIDDGYISLLLLYEDASYGFYDSLLIVPNGINFYQLPAVELLPAEELNQELNEIINKQLGKRFLTTSEIEEIRNAVEAKMIFDPQAYSLSGKVLDGVSGEELIGANIIISKDGRLVDGTVADFDGNYIAALDPGIYDIEVQYVGYTSVKNEGVIIKAGFITKLDFKMGEGALLDEVVVVGYSVPLIERDMTTMGSVITSEQIRNLPTKTINALAGTTAGITWTGEGQDITIRGSRADGTDYYIDGVRVRGSASLIPQSEIKDIRVIEGNEARSVYGADKVVLIETFKAQLFSPEFYAASKNASGIRDNFSDEAFWAPRLTTDATGQVSVPITFPDDITKWDMHVLAMGDKGRAGTAQLAVRSSKPLSGQLSLPRFLLAGDSTKVVGKAFNYSGDTLDLQSTFSINDEIVSSKKISTANANIEKYTLSTTSLDTVKVKYEIEKEDGYLDGEKRNIPVLPVGVEIEKGSFMLLYGDSIVQLNTAFAPNKPVTIYAQVNRRQYIRQQLRRVRNYRYLCNEQLASKLLALMREKELAALAEEEFQFEKDVKEIISRLLKGRNEKRLWGWWTGNEYSPWISNHVGRALMRARGQGYDVGWDPQDMVSQLTYELQSASQPDKILYTMQAIQGIDEAVDQLRYFEQLDTMELTLFQSLLLETLKEKATLPVNRQLVLDNLEADIFGNTYLKHPKEKNYNYRVYGNALQSTLLGYNLLKTDTTRDHSQLLTKMRNYFFANQSNGYWRNTYEASLIVETIWRDIMTVDADKYKEPKLKLKGSVNQEIENFPYKVEVENLEELELEYTGAVPIYITAHQSQWNESVNSRANDLEVKTSIQNVQLDSLTLRAGETSQLDVELIVKKDADYMMIEVPIPAGCTYAKKPQNRGYEVHREYFKDKVAIFCKKLPIGQYLFKIDLIAKYEGQYTLNPAKACLMYFPTFYANTGMKQIGIKGD